MFAIPEEGVSDASFPPVVPPPDNYFLSRGAWPAPHRTGYSQGSSEGFCFTSDAPLIHDELYIPLVTANPINMLYSNDNRYLWGSSFTSVFRVDRSGAGLKLAGSYRQSGDFDVFHGAYSLVNRDDVFIVASGRLIEYFYDCGEDCVAKFPDHFELPNTADDESLRALCMTYDGKMAFATNRGRVGIANQDIYSEDLTELVVDLQLHGPGEATLEMSNGISCDEKGGIYVVTSQVMHKINWDPNARSLTLAWESPYQSGTFGRQPGRLGLGSGSTPSLMGSWDSDAGVYIVLTDGAPRMNVLVMSAATGEVLATKPVTFGNPRVKQAQSEQSVLVHGWRFAVVNNSPNSVVNLNGLNAGPIPMESIAQNLPGVSGHSPTGIEQFRFDPRSGGIETTWTNTRVSLPNGIPTMSAATGTMYGVGKRSRNALEQIMLPGKYRGVWTLEGIDWNSGEHVLSYPIGSSLLRNPVFAAAQIGPGEIVSGNAGGVVRIRQRAV